MFTCWRIWEYYQSLPIDEVQKVVGSEMSPFFVQDLYLGLVFLGIFFIVWVSTPWWGARFKFKRTKLKELHGEMVQLLSALDFDIMSSDIEIKKRTLIPRIKKLDVQCPALNAANSTWQHYLIVLIPLAENKDYKAASEITY